MKTVLFCGGLGTRIRDYSEAIPKPMIPIGGKPILFHLMQSYGQYGYKEFVLCLGYKANVIKDFFFDLKPQMYSDCVVSSYGRDVELIGKPQDDWRITLVDTGIWRNIGERLLAVREYVQDEPYFFANYSDALSDVYLPDMVRAFEKSGKVASFLVTRPPFSLHLANFNEVGGVESLVTSDESDLWINAGYFIFKNTIFDYIQEGDELVEAPFRRLIEDRALMAFKHKGFWRPMDTLKDKQILEDLIEQGNVPWLASGAEKRQTRPSVSRL